MFSVAWLVGCSIAGILISAVCDGISCLFNAICCIAVNFSLLSIKVKPPVLPTKHPEVWRSLKEGFRYAFGFPPIRAIILLIALISLFGMPFSVLMPVFAREILHGGANTLGY